MNTTLTGNVLCIRKEGYYMKVWTLMYYCGDYDSLIGIFSSEQNAIEFTEDMCKEKSAFEGSSKDNMKTWFCDKGENRGLYSIYTSDIDAPFK